MGALAPWVILGCGYAGERVARLCREKGAHVWVTSRDPARARRLAQALDVEARALDVHDTSVSLDWMLPGAVVVDSVPPTPGRPPHQERLVAEARRAGARRIVYLSSTGVYPSGDGGWIDEDTPVGPVGERGAARLAAEAALFAAATRLGVETVALRIAAIYGPGRGVKERLLAGTHRVVGAGDNWVSRIHVDDLAACVYAAGTRQPLARSIYVVADDEPTQAGAYADAWAQRLGVPAPPSVPLAALDPSTHELVAASRRVRNARLKEELGVVLAHPTGL